MAKIQNEDVKSSAELVTAGSDASHLINDTKIYVTGNSINDTLANAIVNGQIGGGGSFNYVSANNGSATTGWTTYANGAAVPTTGTGGSPTLTWASNSSSPLIGANDFLLTPGALGNGVAYAFTPQPGHYGQVMTFEAWFKITTPASYNDGDITFWAYDVTNSQMYQLAPYQLLRSLVAGRFVATFQLPTNSTSFRFLIHQATSNTAYGSLHVDSISVGPAAKTVGPFISDWQTYTPTFTGAGTVSNVNIWYRRDGDSLDVRGTFTTGTTTAVLASMTLPAGLSLADQGLANTTSNPGPQVGMYSTNNATGVGCLVTATGTSTTLVYFSNPWPGTQPPLRPANGASVLYNADTSAINFKVKILGWSSGQLLSSDADTRVVAAKYTGTTTAAPASLTPSVIPCVTKVIDTNAAYSTSTGLFTVPVSGIYAVTFTAYATSTSAAASNAFDIAIYKNGSAFASRYVTAYTTVNAEHSPTITALVNAVAGDTIGGYLGQNLVASTLALSNSARTYIDIQRISGPSQIAASESVNAKYTASTTSVSSATIAKMTTKVFDSHGGYDTSTGRYTVQTPGKYRVTAMVSIPSVSYAVNQAATLAVYKNGSIDTVVNYLTAQTTSLLFMGLSGSTVVSALAGDIIDPRVSTANGSAISLAGGSSDNYFEIERIGN